MGYWATSKEWESTNEYGDGFYYQGLPKPIGKGMRDKSHYRVVPISIMVKE